MTGWLSLTPEQRRTTLEQAFVRSGIQTKAIEKDWWVTLCLKALFSTPYGAHCLFKGGTSLSKAWKVIQRFSEDIDIALAPEAFGMPYEVTPSHSFVKNLKRRGCAFTTTVIKPALEQALLELGVPEGLVVIEAEDIPPTQPDKDPQTLYIRYRSLYEPHPYLSDQVRMEFGVRSYPEAIATVPIQSILSEVFPNLAYAEEPFKIPVAEARKTMLEKLFLLHEKFHRPDAINIQLERQSRHPYDIVALMATPAAAALLEDRSFYDRLLHHRKHYVRLSGVDYSKLSPENLRFVPFVETVEEFRTDYEEMRRSMIYGDSPPFDQLLRQLKVFNGRVRLMGIGLSLEDVIGKFLDQHREVMDSNPKRNIFKGTQVVRTAPDKAAQFEVIMHRLDEWVFEEIRVVN